MAQVERLSWRIIFMFDMKVSAAYLGALHGGRGSHIQIPILVLYCSIVRSSVPHHALPLHSFQHSCCTLTTPHPESVQELILSFSRGVLAI